MKNVMIDTETLAVTSSPLILTIGAVKFDEELGLVDKEALYIPILPKSYRDEDLKVDIDPDTLLWWGRQPGFRDILEEVTDYGISVRSALDLIDKFIDEDCLVWSNGADADAVWLSSLYRQLGRTAPWKWHNVRCVRTMKHLAYKANGHERASNIAESEAKNDLSSLRVVPELDIPIKKELHNALYDAYKQASYVIEVFNLFEERTNK